MLTLSFSDDENGIMKEALKDKDGNNYTAYHLFTYERVKGKTTLHVNGGHGYFNNDHISRVFCNTDYTITIDKQAKSLVLTDNYNHMTFTRTDYAPLSLPSTSMPDVDASSFKLTDSYLNGTWDSGNSGILLYIKFSYRIGDGEKFVGLLVQSNFGTFRQDIIDARHLYPVIEDNYTVALYADPARTKIEFYLAFGEENPYITGHFVSVLNDKREELGTAFCVKQSAN